MSIERINKQDVNLFDKDDMIIFNDKIGLESGEGLNETYKKEFDKKKKNTEKKSKVIKDLYQKKENCIFLTGAGTSYSSGGPLMSDLWGYFIGDDTLIKNKEFLKNVKDDFDEYKKAKKDEDFKKYLSEIKHDIKNKNLEEFLSSLIIYIKNLFIIKGEKDKDYISAVSFKQSIEQELKGLCFIQLSNNSEHFYFIYYINKIRGASNKSRLKIFTLNYDTLFEQTANEFGFTIIDGFSFSSPRKFNSTNFDIDIIEKDNNRVENNKLHENVFHLYKLHGSLNWRQDNDKYYNEEIKDKKSIIGEIIYPGKAKYEKSYDMPYFEMLTRFQFELRKKDVVLNIIGYGFGDDHINRMILEALKNNNSLTLNIFSSSFYDIKGDYIEIGTEDYFIKSIIPYLKMQRINVFNFKFWGLVNLLKVDKPDTLEERLSSLLNPELYNKLNNNDS